MKQTSLGLGASTKRTRRREFLDEMDRVVPWSDLVAEIAPFMPEGKLGRPPFPVESLLRIHFMQQWFTLSDPAMEEALHDVPLFRDFPGLGGWDDRLPDESTILRFRHVLEKHKLAERILATVNLLLGAKGLMLRSGTVVDATLISAPSSTKNASGERDPEMHQSKKGQQWFFGMKAHIGVDADSGLVHTVRGTAGHINDVLEAHSLLHGQETYRGAHKRPDAKYDVQWHVAMRPGLRRLLDKTDPLDALKDQVERIKASIRAKVEHPFRVIKRQFGHVKVRYRGLAKNTAQLHTLFALANLWMVRRRLSGRLGGVRSYKGQWARNTPKTPTERPTRRQSVYVSAPNHGRHSFVQTFLKLTGAKKFKTGGTLYSSSFGEANRLVDDNFTTNVSWTNSRSSSYTQACTWLSIPRTCTLKPSTPVAVPAGSMVHLQVPLQ